MSKIAEWRRKSGLTQADLAIRLGFKSRAHVSALESGAERVSAEMAIAIDRLTSGEVTVATLRPDLSDVHVIQPEGAA